MDELNVDENSVVISGLSGSFPKTNNVEEFMQKLFAKENLLQDVPHMPCKLGKLNNLDKFDAEFFNFHQAHRVNVMDPMARIILEKAYEALIDSGNNPVTLKGTNCGVYIGIHFLETEVLVYEKVQKGASLAVSRSFNANRISYWLGTHGPSYVVDSACSSTLVALEMAYKAIRSGECESALVGGCHVCLHPALLLHLLKVGALNPEGESRVFDKDADGFCKAETIGMFYLQKAKDAKRIYAEVVNVRSNHDGSKPLFLSPYAPSQQMLLKMTYEEARIDPNEVAWVEAHATGTLVGDKQEVTAIDNVFASRETPLLIGSVKSNMGHAEAAAGVGSLSKVIIAMESGFIPPNINVTNLRTDIDAFKMGRIRVVTEKTPWNGGIVGVSGFGMGGANTHVILKSFSKEKVNHGIPDDFVPRVVGVSGRTEKAVEVILNFLEMTSIDAEFFGLLHNIHKFNIPCHRYRGYAVLHKNEFCLFKKIEQFNERPRPVMFTYTNYLNDWSNIYRSLTDLNTFQTAIEKCNEILMRKFNFNLNDILDNGSPGSSLFKGFMCAVTIQIALTDLMTSLNIVPDFIVGYSLGELVCAYVDGCLTLEEVLIATYHCAAFLCIVFENTNDTVTVLIDQEYAHLRGIIPRGINFLFPSIVSGPKEDIAVFLALNRLHSTRRLNTDLADLKVPPVSDPSALEELLEQQIALKPKSEKWISSFEPRGACTVTWSNIVISLVDYLAPSALNTIIPHYLVAIEFVSTKFFNILSDLKGESFAISLTYENHTVNVTDILSALGELYLCGSNPQFDKLYPKIKYPVSRGTKMIAPLVKWKHTTSWPVAFSSSQERMLSGERKIAISLDEKEHAFIEGHRIDSDILYPGAGYLVLVWETLALIYGKLYKDTSVVFQHVRFIKAVNMSKSDAVIFNVMVRKGNGDFEILENGEMVTSGRIYIVTNAEREKMILAEPKEDQVILDKLDFYRYILIRGYNYKDAFRSVQQINSQGTRARVTFNGNWITYLDGLLQMNMLNDETDSLTVPVEIEKIVIDMEKHKKMLSECPKLAEFSAIMDKQVNVIDSAGVQIRGCKFHSLPSKPTNKIPMVQKYLFTPFISTEQELSTKHAVYLFLHILMDYFGQQNTTVKIAEMVNDDTSGSCRSLLSSLFASFIREQPLFQAELKAYFSNDIDFKTTKINVTHVFGKLPLGELVHVIASTDVFRDDNLKRIWDSLHDHGFLIARQTPSEDIFVPGKWYVCCDVITIDAGERYLLLRKKPEMNKDKIKSIKVSSATFEWIRDLQEALKLGPGIHERILLFAEGEPFNGILGFYNCLRLERGTEHVRCFFFMDDTQSFALENESCRSQIAKDLAVNVYKDGRWGCYVRQAMGPIPPIKTYHTFLNTKSEGRKQNLCWFQGPINSTTISDDESLIHVYYAAVNPSDVLVYKNRLSRETILKDPLKKDYVFGMEFSGRDGRGVRYMGLLSHGCLASFIKLAEDDIFVNEVPNNWSLEDAVTVPLAYYIVIYAMVVCGKISHHSRVLIHSAGSVIGQAAMNVATYYNCEIFVTVDSIDEKIFVKENYPCMADETICSSHDTSFEQVIYEQTEGRGVDLVLNTQAGNKLNATVNCLVARGHLIQIKRMDLRNDHLNVNILLKKNISLHSALLEDIWAIDLAEKWKLKNIVDEHIKTSAVRPLVRAVYCHTGIQSAFEDVAQMRLQGKCIVSIELEEEELRKKPQLKEKLARPRFMCMADHTYVVCGGLGGMGMELVNWLVNREAKRIVVTSRRGVQRGSQTLRINRWKSRGVKFLISNADIAKEEEAVRLLQLANKLGPVGGIFNLAAELKDKMFKNHTSENFIVSAAPKLHGTFNLDRVSRLQCPHLRQFVVFSSIACGYGNLGQTNYGMFNSSVERICEQRHEANLPALAIEWGAVGNVGMFVSIMDGNIEKSYAGCYMQPMKSCLEVLDECLGQECPIVASLVVAEKEKAKQ